MLPSIADALERVGIVEPFPIQEMTLPVALTGTDLIGQARTGTGKTYAFAVPLLQRIVAPDERDYGIAVEAGKPQALVVAPTRELASQVTRDLTTASTVRRVRILTLYGGRAYEPQLAALRGGVDVVVGTPGRILDLVGQGELDLGHVKVLVLDEADEMLDLGFLPDVEKIIARTPELRQTMLFSATMPGAVVALARRYLRHPVNVRAEAPDESQTVPTTAQFVFRVHNLDKDEILARVLQAEGRGLAMVFCRTKRQCQRVADEMASRGFAAAAVHGDLGQGAREQALRAFRNGKVDVLVATDVAARGIDVEGVTHVVNFSCPEDDKTYLHRIGRTGRAGASGIAVTLCDWDDLTRWQVISKTLGLPYDVPPETYSTSEHLYHDLGIPKEATGVLPRTRRTREGLEAEQLEDLGEPRGRSGSRPPRGDRDRGPRNDRGPRTERTRGERGGRGRAATGSGPSGADDPVAATPAERSDAAAVESDRPRRTRERRRTRGGATLNGSSPHADPSAASGEATTAPATGGANGEAGTRADGSAPRRRRRSRGSAATPAADAPAPTA